MSKLFLNNASIDLSDFTEFKNGMNNLLVIDKHESHHFYKHESIYNLPVITTLYSNFGYDEQEISRFIEQDLTTSTVRIETENDANDYCGSKFNAFLGIDFNKTDIPEIKRIVDNEAYLSWINSYLTKFETLIKELGNCVYNREFESDFNSMPENVQQSIIDKVIVLKNRNLETTLAPGFQLLKDVTQSDFDFSIMELRISSPIALRIYFKEFKSKTYLGSIESKANPDQNSDIKKAYKIIKHLMN